MPMALQTDLLLPPLPSMSMPSLDPARRGGPSTNVPSRGVADDVDGRIDVVLVLGRVFLSVLKHLQVGFGNRSEERSVSSL